MAPSLGSADAQLLSPLLLLVAPGQPPSVMGLRLPLSALLLLLATLLSAARAQHDTDQSQPPPEKRQRERNQFVPYNSYAPREPSCEQLRAMWKLSKRQHRNAVRTNAVPRYQEPYLLGRVHDTLRHNPLYDAPRHRPQPTFGTVVNGPGEHQRQFATPALTELVQSRPAGRPADHNLRDLVRMLERPELPAAPPEPQSLSGAQYGRVRLYPRPRSDASAARRLFQRRAAAAAPGRHRRIPDL
ncbi:hypothetical protein FJT64_008481 [Amphibalanus amphitrite]|uniref:Uncharacterized protein n=2 Tax=Amphibalanus amphitrite TaxID=1232801 RepID=A0A6A4VBU3_AMPAM|nr:hypothetical protein FJT64_008481 [Amphibalanus amphitrite]